jgi:arsenate reductase (glutaredoxin)
LAVAEERGLEYRTVLYMKKAERPDRAALEALAAMLEDPVEDLVRDDSRFKKLGLDRAQLTGKPKAVVDLLERHPELLQRPVIVRGKRAIIGRPRDRVPSFLG